MTAKASLHGRGYVMPRLDARQVVWLLNSQRDAYSYARKDNTTLWLLENQRGREKGGLHS